MNQTQSPLAKALEPLLERIFNTIIDAKGPHNFSDKAFFDATYLFNTVAGDVMFQLMDKEGIDRETRIDMAEKFGKEIRHLIKVYTGKDMHLIAEELIKDASDRVKQLKHEEEMKKRRL
jgi:hypothetical protein